MKIIKMMLVALTFFSLTSNAQEQEEYDCSFYYKKAILYLKGDKYIEKDPQKAITYLKPCAEKGFDKAQMLLGKLYSFQNNEEADKNAFNLFKKAAKQGNSFAMTDLGIMYKYGRGCKLNFNKARKWFKKSAELGNDKAAYSLGYLYFKGFGNISQDYEKALKWFKKSEYPMAKYWLGICYYKGYGVNKDILKANELLETNLSSTSISSENIAIEEDVIESNKESLDSDSVIDISQEDLIGKWKGKLIQLDWSGNHIEKKNNISLEVVLDSATDDLISTINFKEKIIEDKIIKLDNSIYFDNTSISLPHESFSNEIPSILSHQILSGDLQLKTLNNNQYLIIKIESYVNDWNEKGTPISLILTRKNTFENSEEELSNDVLKALSEQEENFIKLYPNPFQKDLIISYKLDNIATTKVEISDLYGNTNSVIEKENIKEQGEYRYFFDGSELKSGIYVVSVLVNNKKHTRVIIKK